MSYMGYASGCSATLESKLRLVFVLFVRAPNRNGRVQLATVSVSYWYAVLITTGF